LVERSKVEWVVQGVLDGLQKLGMISRANPEGASEVVDIMKNL